MTTLLLFSIGVGDRNRTCIVRICNPSPNHSAAHPHNSGTPTRIRTERLLPFERSDFTNLSIGALAEDIRFELMHPFLNDGLANRCLNHSANLPYRNTLLVMYFYMAEVVRFELTEHFCSLVFKTSTINRTRSHFHLAGDTRIELVLRDSKSPVLPLHKSPTKNSNF